MGGWIGYNYAPLHPAQVGRLIIVDMGPEIMPVFNQRLRSSLQASDVFDSPEHVFRHMRAENPRASDEELIHRAKHNVTQRADGKWIWRYDRGFRNGTRPIERPAPEQQWQALARITCPTLLVRGAETDLLARETAERMISVIPNCQYVEIPHAGHSVFTDNPGAFIAAVKEFLSQRGGEQASTSS
jgi:pimeloyl-ACP methyl ester carboxylesterase